MQQKKMPGYEHTIYACYIGYITQAIVNNFAPLLFLTFATGYRLSLDQLTMITVINFLVQLVVDLVSAGVIEKIGARAAVLAAHGFAAAGLAGMALLPRLLPDPYAGLLGAAALYAIGGGLIEVEISPIVEACPTTKKEAAMSLLHSFYCWGHLGVVLLSTLFFKLFGIENWPVLACLWALVPLANIFYFAKVPIYPVVAGHEKLAFGTLLRQKVFWLLVVLMVCAGASEQAMSQWASAFAESALGVSKAVGDLAGPCAFALCMGTARAIYGKFSDHLPLKKMMAGSAVLCIGCYLLAAFAANPVLALVGCAFCGFSVGIFWPGTFSVAAWSLPRGGMAMYAAMALAGDLGCSGGPAVVGFLAGATGGSLKTGLAAALVFPVVMLLGTLLVKEKTAKSEE